MDCRQAVDQLADGRRQSLVGRLRVGPEGVATGWGYHDGVQDRAQRRSFDEGDVGVPALTVALLGSHPVGELAGLRVVDLEDLLVFLDTGDDGVCDRDRAERGGEVLVLGRREVLRPGRR